MPEVDNFKLRNEELHMLSKYILKIQNERQKSGRNLFSRRWVSIQNLYSSKKYPELTKPC